MGFIRFLVCYSTLGITLSNDSLLVPPLGLANLLLDGGGEYLVMCFNQVFSVCVLHHTKAVSNNVFYLSRTQLR